MSRRLVIVAVAAAWVVLHARPDARQFTNGLPAASSTASSHRVAHWTTADGLPQNSVLDVLVLPNDEMWLATFGGLVSFDGVRFTVIDTAVDANLPSHRIVGLQGDGANTFWFLTQSGHLGQMSGGRTVTRVEPPDLAQDAIGLVADGTGQLLAKLRDGTLWRTDGTTKWIPVPPPPSMLVPHLSISPRHPGAAVAWKQRLLLWKSNRLVDEAALPRARMDLFNGPGDQLWLADGPSMWRYDAARFHPLTITPPLTTAVTAMATSAHGDLWVASRGELSRLERRAADRWQRVVVPLGLASGMLIRRLVVDRQNSLWVGTDGQGLFRVSKPPVRMPHQTTDTRAAQGLATDGDGGAFVAQSCLELRHIDRQGVTSRVDLRYDHDGRNDIGCGLALSRAGTDSVYVRLGRRLLRVDRPTLGVTLVTDSLSADEGPILTAPDGTVWVVSRQGMVERVLKSGVVEQVARVAPPVMSAALAPDGTLWVGGEGRVEHVTGARVVTFDSSSQVPRGPVRDILPESDGTVWIGTYGGGLGRLRDGRVTRLTTGAGLPDNSISRILTDVRGRIWISTNRGIAVATRSELLAAADGGTQIEPVVFGLERGVSEANFGTPAGFSADDGQLWFSTIEGPVVIDAAAFPADAAAPTVKFERVSADDLVLPLGTRIEIPPHTRRVRIDFSANERLYPDSLRFRFRVENTDTTWLVSGNTRSVSWTPPGPGQHRLLVEARSADGLWSATPTAIVLDVQYAWWQRRTVQGAAALVIVIAVIVVFRQRVRRLKARHEAQLRTLAAERHAEAMTNSLRMQLDRVSRTALAGELAASVAHEVRQPIGAMVNNAEAARRNLATYLQRPADLDAILNDLVADGLRATNVIKGLYGLLRTDGADTGALNLSALVREVLPLVRRELSDAGATIDLALAEDLPLVEGSGVQLGQVIVNLLLNAGEAVAGLPGERRVAVITAHEGGSVTLSVCDSGPGPAASVEQTLFEPFVTTKTNGMGMGLAISRSIAERHGGRLSADRPATGGFCLTLSLPAMASDRAH
jgi:signal transduction histidine kinase/ligand-binding sensor domain-containing protein